MRKNRIKESQEQVIEEWLKQEFPIDKVKKLKRDNLEQIRCFKSMISINQI